MIKRVPRIFWQNLRRVRETYPEASNSSKDVIFSRYQRAKFNYADRSNQLVNKVSRMRAGGQNLCQQI